MRLNHMHLAFWLGFMAIVGSALASPSSDVFRDTFGVDRLVVVAAVLGGFFAVTFAGSMALTIAGVLNSICRVIASGSFGIYCGSLASPLVSGAFGVKLGAIAPATAAFLVALAAPVLYGRITGWLKKEK